MNKIIFVLLIILIYSCKNPNPNLTSTGKDELIALEVDHNVNNLDQAFQDIIYIPIYSDIYIDQLNQKNLLSATLSIRNTSYTDSLFISKIDYFDTQGSLVRNYIDNLISLPPMATINYVIERDDESGGSGANFIVELSSNNTNVKPLIQAVMIGENGNKAFSFTTQGISILAKN